VLIQGVALIANAQPAESGADSLSNPPKYLLFGFFSPGTMNSKMVRDRIINSGPASEIIKESYQLVLIEQGKDLEKESFYKITRYPTLVIAQPDGAEVDRIIGLRKPEEVAETLKAAASGQSQIARAKESAAAPGAGIKEHTALAAAMRMRNDSAGALKEYIWILDNGESADPRLYSSLYRLTIQQLGSFGKVYAPALEELSKRRDAAVHAAGMNAPSAEVIEHAFIMNEALNQPSRNVPLYLKIPADNPLKRRLFPDVFLALVRDKKYQEATSVADLEDFVGLMYPRFRGATGHHASSGHDHDYGQQAGKQKIILCASAACEALLALGDVEKAKRVAGHALDYLGEDGRGLIARLNAIAAQSGANAKDFPAWLASCAQFTQSTKPKSP